MKHMKIFALNVKFHIYYYLGTYAQRMAEMYTEWSRDCATKANSVIINELEIHEGL